MKRIDTNKVAYLYFNSFKQTAKSNKLYFLGRLVLFSLIFSGLGLWLHIPKGYIITLCASILFQQLLSGSKDIPNYLSSDTRLIYGRDLTYNVFCLPLLYVGYYKELKPIKQLKLNKQLNYDYVDFTDNNLILAIQTISKELDKQSVKECNSKIKELVDNTDYFKNYKKHLVDNL